MDEYLPEYSSTVLEYVLSTSTIEAAIMDGRANPHEIMRDHSLFKVGSFSQPYGQWHRLTAAESSKMERP